MQSVLHVMHQFCANILEIKAVQFWSMQHFDLLGKIVAMLKRHTRQCRKDENRRCNISSTHFKQLTKRAGLELERRIETSSDSKVF